MTDIEVGSLWQQVNERSCTGIKVVCVTKNVYTEDLDDGTGYCWSSISDFLLHCTPYTPLKEYKVWVYETPDGTTVAWDSISNLIGWTLKAILTGKEGDGL